MIKILVIGCGPHATHFYLPVLKRRMQYDKGISIAGVLDVDSQRTFVLEELNSRGFEIESWFVKAFEKDELSIEAEALLDALYAKGVFNAVIISTDPLHHKCYALWALQRGLPILLDKPVSTRVNALLNLDEAEGITKDYEELLTAYESYGKGKTPFILCAHRRYHPGILEVRKIINEVAKQTSCPVTNIHSAHSDGQWRLPKEILEQKHHSYNQGHGKISHSGFHFIDCVVEFWREGFASGKLADSVEVISSFVRPSGFIHQISENDYRRMFGQKYTESFNIPDSRLLDLYQGCGELDANIVMSLLKDNIPYSMASLSLLHGGYSRRGWLEPSRDLYKGNGRVKHEEHVIHVGPFLNIQVHSYQSKDKHDICSAEQDEQPGGNNHFEIHVFRNDKMIGGKCYEKFTLKEIPEASCFSSDRLFITQVKERSIEEWLGVIRGEITISNKLKSNFADHFMSVKLMSAIYKSYCQKALGESPCCIVSWED